MNDETIVKIIPSRRRDLCGFCGRHMVAVGTIGGSYICGPCNAVAELEDA